MYFKIYHGGKKKKEEWNSGMLRSWPKSRCGGRRMEDWSETYQVCKTCEVFENICS